ncbi:MAG TPA: DUF308 domain-containing protein [Allosphingosinicella sp.]
MDDLSPENRADGTRRPNGRRSLLLACGLVVLACGIGAIISDAAVTRGIVRTTGYLLLVAGAAEILAGFAHRRLERTEGRLDIILGLISLAVASFLILSPAHTASRFAGLLTLWLLLRGGIDILAAFLTRDFFIEEGRLLRASVDMVLGLVSYIGLSTTAWWERLLGWPSTAAAVTFLLAGISLSVSGLFLIAISRGSRFRVI